MKFRCKFATFLSKQNNGKDIYLIRNSQEFVITCTARTMTKFFITIVKQIANESIPKNYMLIFITGNTNLTNGSMLQI